MIQLGINSDVEFLSLIPSDFRSVLNCVRATEPNEIYNLSGQTSVGLSFDLPVESIDSILTATTNFLEVLRFFGGDIRFFSAGSSECFGNTGKKPATEISSMQPRSPYAVAKSAAFWLVSTYREAYGLYACTGLLANHESPLRPSRFVTQKIIQGLHDIKLGKQDYLELETSVCLETGVGLQITLRQCLQCSNQKSLKTILLLADVHFLYMILQKKHFVLQN